MVFENGVKNIQATAYNGVRTVIRVSNETGRRNFSGQRDRNFFLVPGQRDNGTSSKFCHGTGRDFDSLSRPVPGRPAGQKRKKKR